MPSWAVASIEPSRSTASMLVAARLLPASASGSRAERRTAIAANSAPTKNALPKSRTSETT
jgi:hypothetical protein